MRTLFSAGAIAVTASAALLLAPSAYATGAHGDNGTVKIHDATTGDELRKNEPHVCTFYLDAFGFDSDQQVDWHIEAWAPTAHVKGESVKSGSLTLGSDGHGRTDDLSLPDGHYKLFWNFDGEHGSAKHKVFWTDCSDSGNEQPGGKPSASPAEGATAQPSASASGSPSPGAVEPTSTAPSSKTSSQPSSNPSSKPSSQTGGDLAETGSSAPVGLLATVAAVLVAAGGALIMWRRKAAGRQS
ncbi:hypothetical protein EOT10_31895 [Streptomyces antnestii]|uniref:LPXTG cell wall anchor domain-containing protein n=1 Tax=Streptomyces antnestii TaxID=2494256 RepID=A0A3S2VVK3_9ACTN|nr:hypothetical protein [Streptomyces sp. San01]RVU18622.1 hypothetical protein EOT10_31895 [Streptomyces sp. San01]